ncbi:MULTISPECIES: hypothetical protein [unclassified Bradyrhizobium]
MIHDRYGLPLTTSSDRAAAYYVDGVDRMLAALHGADAAFEAAIAEDPDFALAHIGRARVHQLNMEGAKARAKAADARQLAAAASPRERQHIEILASVIESQPRKAVTEAERHLTEYPRDAQVLSLLLGAFGLYAFSGRPDHDPHGLPSANVTPASMATIGGSSPISAGRRPRPAMSCPAAPSPSAAMR